jgi:flagellum-specific ATP synthase
MLSSNVLRRVARAVSDSGPISLGRVVDVNGLLIKGHLADARIGDMVEIQCAASRVSGEVVGFRDGLVLMVPFGDVRGISAGASVSRRGDGATIQASPALLGRAVNAFGAPIDAGPAIEAKDRVPIQPSAPLVEERANIHQRFDTGVRVIDGLLTCGRGQRVGIFAGAGVGKTVLMRQIATQSQADVTVIGLVGERGCEVRDMLSSGVGKSSVVVAATCDRSPMERVRGARAATALAEYFRDQGANVLLIIDSLTRYAMALREIGLSAGEPPATKGYPPSVFATLPTLLERVSPMASGGSITGIYTILVEGDDLADPVADSARSLLDAHIVLSRDLAARGHFPAVDVLASASRVVRQVTTPDAQQLMTQARTVLATQKEVDELRSLGAYVPGTNPVFDQAVAIGGRIARWARQSPSECASYAEAMGALNAAVKENGR